MSDFVEQCKEEWRRLRVPDPVANEMAADLAADLNEAEDEGASPEEVLGSGAFDPRSFAASWAAERGVVPPTTSRDEEVPSEQGVIPSPTQHGNGPRRSRVLAAIAAFAVIALIGAAITHGSVSSVAVVRVASAAGPKGILVTPKHPFRVLPQGRVIPGGIGPFAPGVIMGDNPSSDLHGLGVLLLVLGLLGVVLTTLYWLYSARPAQRTPNAP